MVKRSESQRERFKCKLGQILNACQMKCNCLGFVHYLLLKDDKICLRNKYWKRQLWGGTHCQLHMTCIEVINTELHLRNSIVIRLRVLLSTKMKHRMFLLFHSFKITPKSKNYSAVLVSPGKLWNPLWPDADKGSRKHTAENPASADGLSRWPNASFPSVILFCGFDAEGPVDIYSAAASLEALIKIWFGT